MQKKLIALAVAGLASTAAFAQTNVVVYGVADGTFDYVWTSGRDVESSTAITNTTANGPVGVGNTVRTSAFSNTRQSADFDGNTRVSANSSYLGFKGSEDLGNGLKAIFQYEMGLDFTSGNSALTANRDSFVGLSHANAGTVVLGNLTGPTRALGAALDVFPGATGIGANSAMIGKIAGSMLKSVPTYTRSVSGGTVANPILTVTETASISSSCARGSTCTSIFDTRWANAIAYLSPNWGGFSFAAAYVANENKSEDWGATYNNTLVTARLNTDPAVSTSTSTITPFNQFAQQPINTYGYDLGAKWEGMGFMVGLTYNWAQFGDILDTTVDNLRLGGMYTAPNWSVRAMWEQTQQKASTNFFFADLKQQKYGLGGTFNIGKTTLLAQWYGANDADNTSDTGSNFYTIGANYNLSKRTMLKAVWAYVDNDKNAQFDFGINSAGGFTRTTSGAPLRRNRTGLLPERHPGVNTTSAGSGAGVQGIQVGIRHSF
ncbi:MAG: porin [Dechloromonas sp.]|nr:MAG: porin [Dechloromonas sp.]